MTVYVALLSAHSPQIDLHLTSRPELEEAWSSLSFLRATYPNFDAWYWSKVVPGIVSGERRIFVEKHKDCLSGLVIAKRADENKLCTIWTHPEMRGRGVATRLVRCALEWLGTDRPIVTVPEETLKSFHGLFRNFGFEHRYAIAHYYRDDSVEHIFNGVLRPACHS